jgi:hypothetical protein
VTRFEIDQETSESYLIHEAGGREHQELWVPAEELDTFNNGIVGSIKIVATYRDGIRITD